MFSLIKLFSKKLVIPKKIINQQQPQHYSGQKIVLTEEQRKELVKQFQLLKTDLKHLQSGLKDFQQFHRPL